MQLSSLESTLKLQTLQLNMTKISSRGIVVEDDHSFEECF